MELVLPTTLDALGVSLGAALGDTTQVFGRLGSALSAGLARAQAVASTLTLAAPPAPADGSRAGESRATPTTAAVPGAQQLASVAVVYIAQPYRRITHALRSVLADAVAALQD